MYVKSKMTTNVVTIFKDASIDLAYKTMIEKGCNQLPVVENGELVGMVTDQLLADVSPSKATTLSMYELNYLLSKTKVKDIMVTDMPTGTPEMLIEEAAGLLASENVDSLPIVEGKKLVGIITRTDIISSFLDLTGINDSGTRISIEVSGDHVGILADIATIISKHDVNIVHVINYTHIGDNDHQEIVIRLATLETDEVIKSLKEAGYKILSVKYRK